MVPLTRIREKRISAVASKIESLGLFRRIVRQYAQREHVILCPTRIVILEKPLATYEIHTLHVAPFHHAVQHLNFFFIKNDSVPDGSFITPYGRIAHK